MLGELKEIGDQIRELDQERAKLVARRDVLLRIGIEEGFSVTHLARLAALTQPRVTQMKNAILAQRAMERGTPT